MQGQGFIRIFYVAVEAKLHQCKGRLKSILREIQIVSVVFFLLRHHIYTFSNLHHQLKMSGQYRSKRYSLFNIDNTFQDVFSSTGIATSIVTITTGVGKCCVPCYFWIFIFICISVVGLIYASHSLGIRCTTSSAYIDKSCRSRKYIQAEQKKSSLTSKSKSSDKHSKGKRGSISKQVKFEEVELLRQNHMLALHQFGAANWTENQALLNENNTSSPSSKPGNNKKKKLAVRISKHLRRQSKDSKDDLSLQ